MEKSFKFLLILLAIFMLIGSLNIVSASNIHVEAVLDDSSLSSDLSEDIVSVNDNMIYVSNYGNDELGDGSINSPYASLSKAINKSENGSIICLNGSFSGEKNINLIIDKNLSIISFNLAYINGDSTSRIFNVLEGNVLSISNLSFSSSDVSNLDNSNGGAIYSEGILIVNNCEFNNCVANNGGAIYSKGRLLINNSKFYNNRAFASGGAIYCSADNSLVNNSGFIENYAQSKTTEVSGGAIWNNGTNFTVSHCLFDGNNAKETSRIENGPIYGGAIANYGQDFYIYDCDFLNNYVEIRTDAGTGEACLNTADGGAIYTVASAKVENSRFDNDTSHCRYSSNQVNLYGNKCYGGAISIEKGEGFYLLNCTFVNCSAADGVVKNYANNAIFENNTFDNGKAMFMGSSIYDHGENDIYRGNIFLNNNNKNTAQGTVYVDACNVTFENNAFLDNYDTSGSGHASNNAAIYIYNPTFRGGSDAGETNIKISNNNFDGNDRGIYLYCAEGAVISNNSFTNQKGQAIDTYVGGYLQILDNYFENNHGYHGALDINSHDTVIRGNTFVNNSGTCGGAIGLLCRDNVVIDSNTFIDNHASSDVGGGDIYSLYSDMTVTNNDFTINPIYDDENSIFTEYGKINATNNTFTISDNTHKIIKQISQVESFLENIIYDNTPIHKDETVSSVDVEDLVDLRTRTPDDFKYYRNETPIVLEDDPNSGSSSGSDDPIKEIIDDIIDEAIEGSGEGGDGSSISSGGTKKSTGSSTNSSSDVGKSPDLSEDPSAEVSSEPSPASSDNVNSQKPSNAAAYDLTQKNQGLSSNSMSQFTVLIIVLAILLIYGFYRGRKDI
ncbi:MAG: right-handed parallel beta-helix repeat-containing protein [Methanobacteriaceae archaeon]|nr:right-handed parallel beta-helix repeat-containing protein [Methanobacteriaceae archaeon]